MKKQLEIVRDELTELLDKYSVRAEKEKKKRENAYVTIKGEKCYTADDINMLYQCDVIRSSRDCDLWLFKLETKKNNKSPLFYTDLCRILRNMIKNLNWEIEETDD